MTAKPVARQLDKVAGVIILEGSPTVLVGDQPIFVPSIIEKPQIKLPEEFSLENAAPLIKTAGRYAPLDEPAVISQTPASYPADPDNEGSKQSAEVENKNPPDEIDVGCPAMTEPDYTYRLSPNFTLIDFSIGAVFKHPIVAQQGLSVAEIVCNLKHLAINIADPIVSQFGRFQLNSGFRVGAGNSQHCKGMAVDMQWSGISNQEYLQRAKWIAENLNCDQVILEKGKSYWIHVSYDRNKSSGQRRQALSMLGDGKFIPGLQIA